MVGCSALDREQPTIGHDPTVALDAPRWPELVWPNRSGGGVQVLLTKNPRRLPWALRLRPCGRSSGCGRLGRPERLRTKSLTRLIYGRRQSGQGFYSKTRRAPAFRRGLTPKRWVDDLVVLAITLPTRFPNSARRLASTRHGSDALGVHRPEGAIGIFLASGTRASARTTESKHRSVVFPR